MKRSQSSSEEVHSEMCEMYLHQGQEIPPINNLTLYIKKLEIEKQTKPTVSRRKNKDQKRNK